MLRSTLVALALVVAALVVPLAAPSRLEAQQPSAQTRNAARDAYGRGQTAFREGRFEEAEASFTEAFTLIPNPVVLLGVAEARERLGNVPGAIATLEQYLTLRTEAPDAAQIQERLTVLRATPGTLAITSTPEGAAIAVDGTDTGAVTPAELPAPPGEHAIALTLEGHEAATTNVTLPPGGRAEASAELVVVEPEPEPVVAATPPPTEPIVEDTTEADALEDDGPGAAVWVTSGVAAAALVGGTVLGFMALSREAEFDDEPTVGRADDGERFALFADVLFGVAGAAAITAIVLFLTSGDDADDEPSDTALTVSPTLGRRAGGLSAQLTF